VALLRNQPIPTEVGHKTIGETTSNLQNCSLLLLRKIIKKRQNREILPLIGYVQRNDIYLNTFIMLIGRSVPGADVNYVQCITSENSAALVPVFRPEQKKSIILKGYVWSVALKSIIYITL
jgi:hypothetical protein